MCKCVPKLVLGNEEKLFHTKWNVSGQDRYPRILLLANRNVLRDQAYNTFEPFEGERDIFGSIA